MRTLACIALVGIWLGTTPLLAQEEAAKQSQEQLARDRAEADTQTVYPPLRMQIVEPPEETEARNRREQEAADRERNDLEAQQVMATKTKELSLIGWAQIVISLLGFGALFYTLALTRRTARSAEAANAISADTAKRQLRAYVSMHANTVARRTNDVIGVVELINSGQTPAEILGYSCRVNIDSPWAQTAPELGQFREHRLLMGAGITNRFAAEQGVPWDTTRDLELSTCAISIRLFGYVRYKDVFGDEHSTYFAHMICGNGATPDAPLNIDRHGRNDGD